MVEDLPVGPLMPGLSRKKFQQCGTIYFRFTRAAEVAGSPDGFTRTAYDMRSLQSCSRVPADYRAGAFWGIGTSTSRIRSRDLLPPAAKRAVAALDAEFAEWSKRKRLSSVVIMKVVPCGVPRAMVWCMDHAWAAQQLREFQEAIDDFYLFSSYEENEYVHDDHMIHAIDSLIERHGSRQDVRDRLISLNPVMRNLMNAAQAGLGDYVEAPDGGWTYDGDYWREIVKPHVLRAIGIHEFGEEARRRMQPDSPDLTADQFHPWVWEAAAPLWYAGSRQEAVHAAARSVNARMQQKRGHHDKSDAALCRDFFSLDKPTPGRPRLRFGGYTRTDLTWRSRQQGAMEFGAGCFEGIRNPAAHEHGLVLSEQVSLEQLAAFSLLARWIDECEVETAPIDG